MSDDLHEIYQEIEALTDRDTARALAMHFGGQQVYFPYWDSGHKRRDKRILRDRRSGMSYADLARKHGLTERRIRDILHSHRARQITLPLGNAHDKRD